MKEILYKIFDCYGLELPPHYSGRHRTEEEATIMVKRLNRDGDYSPYTMVKAAMVESISINKIEIKPSFGHATLNDDFEYRYCDCEHPKSAVISDDRFIWCAECGNVLNLKKYNGD